MTFSLEMHNLSPLIEDCLHCILFFVT